MKQTEIAEKSLEKLMHAIDSNSSIFNKTDMQTLIQAMFFEMQNSPRVVFVDDKYVMPLEMILRAVVQVILEKKRDLNKITQQEFSALSAELGLGGFPEFFVKTKYTGDNYNKFKESLYDYDDE